MSETAVLYTTVPLDIPAWQLWPCAPRECPRWLLDQKDWDVNAFLATAGPRDHGLLFVQDNQPFAYALLRHNAVYRHISIDTLIVDQPARSMATFQRCVRALHPIAVALAKQAGYPHVRWMTPHPKAMQRALRGLETVRVCETLVEVEIR